MNGLKYGLKISAFTALLVLINLSSCTKEKEQSGLGSGDYHKWMGKLHSAIVRDGFPPPLAARIYAYANIAAYQALVNGYPDFNSLAGQINGLTETPKPDPNAKIDFPLAAMIAFSTTGTAIIFSEDTLKRYDTLFLNEVKKSGLDQKVIDASVAYGRSVGKAIVDYIAKDHYKETRPMTDYVLKKKPGYWEPTPPDYMPAFEPYWNMIRPFAMEKADQFMPERPIAFDSTKGSPYMNQVLEVYNAVQNRTPEQETIARYWDDNPAVSNNEGHVSIVDRKLTPPGHWMYMVGQACRAQKLDLIHTVEAYTLVAMAMHDAVISCWDEKYRSQCVRPVTVINKYVDETWSPILQTPAFPEYTSGHSCFSGAASTVCTKLFGDNFAYTDSSELKYGMKTRQFKSFNDAAKEAASSRLYGGIHFHQACEVGIVQGQQVGANLLVKVHTRKDETAKKGE